MEEPYDPNNPNNPNNSNNSTEISTPPQVTKRVAQLKAEARKDQKNILHGAMEGHAHFAKIVEKQWNQRRKDIQKRFNHLEAEKAAQEEQAVQAKKAEQLQLEERAKQLDAEKKQEEEELEKMNDYLTEKYSKLHSKLHSKLQ